MELFFIELNDSRAPYPTMLINLEQITKIKFSKNFIALSDGSEFVVTDETMTNLYGVLEGRVKIWA